MALATVSDVVLGSVAFSVFWVLAVFPAVPFLPIGRTAGSLLGAMLMVIFHVIGPEQAYASIDLPILALLFGTMVVSIYLEKAQLFKYLGKLLSWKSRGNKDLLVRICLISAFSSALFTNDTTCIVLTEFVLKLARQHNLPPKPFLLALASSANIGSTATPIGNPQNLVIAVQSKISFGKFFIGILPSMLVGVFINTVLLLLMFWRSLSPSVRDVEKEIEEVVDVDVRSYNDDENDEVSTHRFSPARMSHLLAHEGNPEENKGVPRVVLNVVKDGSDQALPSDALKKTVDKRALFLKSCIYVVAVGMLVSLLMGLNMSWTAITAALALVVLDFRDAGPCLDKVSYSLLVFFCGMFITVDGFNRTGIPSAFWNFMEPFSRINRTSGVVVLSLVILLLSNIASNVPTVLLLGAQVASSAAAISPEHETKAWLILAWVSTVAGNLSLLGSAANLIVCEQARRSQDVGYTLSFWGHLIFGVPSTLIVTSIGLPLIRA
ncbi:hypothetical protein J5N97_024064 [Dioscorea zingiberensis]|uniref:Citrate transporter-like domain-containing protein n=1 Tax=Dioscorea zingiberensis TaxID=325984 RepID=A0A9D5C5V7_9LILI|nr:hypothetical protein J5N97_024064 [Dioscorea zingiberensis]